MRKLLCVLLILAMVLSGTVSSFAAIGRGETYIGSSYQYEDIQSALNELSRVYKTIILTLTSDLNLKNKVTLPAGADVTLNMDGHIIFNEMSSSEKTMFEIPYGSTLRINGASWQGYNGAIMMIDGIFGDTSNQRIRAFDNKGTLYICDCEVVANFKDMITDSMAHSNIADGGIIYNSGSVYLSGSAKLACGQASKRGGCVYCAAGSVFAMADSSVVDCGRAPLGGGLYCEGGATVSLKDNAKISDCVADYTGNTGAGGAVFGDDCVLTLSGNSAIKNCKAAYGGAVFLRSSSASSSSAGNTPSATNMVMLEKAKIDSCTAQIAGGGICLTNAGVSMRGSSSISGCKSDGNGGGICSGNYLGTTLQKREISVGGSASVKNCNAKNGGAIYQAKLFDVILDDNSSFAGNKAGEKGETVYVAGADCNTTIKGNSSFASSGNNTPFGSVLYMAGASNAFIYENASAPYDGYQIYSSNTSSDISIYGNVLLGIEDGVCVPFSGAGKISVTGGKGFGGDFGALAGKSSGIKISGGNFAKELPSSLLDSASICKYTDASEFPYKVVSASEGCCSLSGKLYDSVARALSANPGGGTIVLNKDVIENVTVSTKTVTIDLNGHTFTAKSDSSPVITVASGDLTVKDSSSGKSGRILSAGSVSGIASCVKVNSGAKFTFAGGRMVSGSASEKKGKAKAAVLNEGTFIMNGSSEIYGSYSSEGAAAVYNKGSFTMSGSSCISDCISKVSGAAVINEGSFTGSESAAIKNCLSEKNGGGIYGAGTVTLNKSFAITGCCAEGSGAAIYSSGKVSASNKEISGASKIEGGIVCMDSAKLDVSGSCEIHSLSEGPAITGKGSSVINISGGFIGAIDADSKSSVSVSSAYLEEVLPDEYLGASGMCMLSQKPPKAAYPYVVSSSADRITLTIYANNGSGDSTEITGIKTEGITLPEPVYTYPGFIFSHYSTSEYGSGGVYYSPGKNFTESTEVYMIWDADPEYPRTLTYVDTYGKNGSIDVAVKGSEVITTDAGFVRKGFVLNSWNSKADGSGTNFPVGCKLLFGKSVKATLYAQWVDEASVKPGSMGSGKILFVDPSENNESFTYRTTQPTVVLTSLGFTRSGYSFDSWNTASDGSGKVFKEGSTLSTEGGAILYAQWKLKSENEYSTSDEEAGKGGTEIIYDEEGESGKGGSGSGGENEPKVVQHQIIFSDNNLGYRRVFKTSDGAFKTIENPFARSGYIFVGWNTKENGKGTDYKENVTVSFGSKTEITLYAKWASTSPEPSKDPTKPDPGNNEKKPYEEISEDIGGGESGGDTPGKNTPTDVGGGEYYDDPSHWAVEEDIENGKVIGYDENGDPIIEFGVGENCTRAEMVKYIWKAAGSPEAKASFSTFGDVAIGSDYEEAVIWAYEQGIVEGMSDTVFAPDKLCSRAHAVTFLWRTVGEPEPKASKTGFADVASSQYYFVPVIWAVEEGVTDGVSAQRFAPDNNCLRVQIITYLYRFYGGGSLNIK